MTRSPPISGQNPRGISIRPLDLRSVPARAVTIASAILVYPALLALFFWSGRIATQASNSFLRIAGWTGVAIFMALALSLPVLGFVIARSHVSQPLSAGDLAIRRMAHLTWMAPPLYTATGVWLLILGLPAWKAWGLDAAVWILAWTMVFALIVRGVGHRPREARVRPSDTRAAAHP